MNDLDQYWTKLSFRRALPRIGLPEDSALPVVELAQMLALSGERAAAAEAFSEVLAETPDNVDIMEKLAGVLGRLGRLEQQTDLYRRIAAAASDKLGIPSEQRDAVIQFESAARGVAEVPPAAPPEFVALTFDAFADEFEKQLRETLQYRGPEQIMQRVQVAFGRRNADLTICDAGCGTGVLGPFLRPYASSLEGVDLSPRMVEKASERNVYDRLDVAELVAHLKARASEAAPQCDARASEAAPQCDARASEAAPQCDARAAAENPPEGGRFNIIIAADVFVYIGDLQAVFHAVFSALKPGGHFFFTVEQAEGETFVLNYNGRYAHPAIYLRTVASQAGLTEVSIEEEVLRRERGLPVLSWVAAFKKTGGGG